MRSARFLFNSMILAGFLVVPALVRAQQWSGIIDPSRAVDWSSVSPYGGVGNRTTICATLNPGATAAQINSALQSCAAGGVVYLNAGTYNIAGIDFGGGKSNVTLRGAGADKTLLVFNSTAAVGCNGWWSDVCMHSADTNYRGAPSNTANWTAGYTKGSKVITLSSAANLKVGAPVILDQLNDDSSGSNDGDNGSIYVCAVSACSDDAGGGPGGAGRLGRDQVQIVTVTACSPACPNSGTTQVTISTSIYMPNWRSGQKPAAYWATSPVFNNSIEDLTLDHSSSNDKSGMAIFNCSGCAVRGIRSVNSNRSHVWILYSRSVTVRDSYFYGTLNAVSQSYGVETFPGGDVLVENNIFQKVTSPQMLSGPCSGCVFGYNFSINDYQTASPAYLYPSAWVHAAGIDNVLFEGNVGAGLYSDVFHGSHHFLTAFRNRWNGWQPGIYTHGIPVALWPYSRFYNLVGNVLGDVQLPQNTYTSSLTLLSGEFNASIFTFGKGTVNCCLSGDPNVERTVMRWGNYDTVSGKSTTATNDTSGVRFAASEVPSGITSYANAVPATQSLPASFYLSGQPAFWSTPNGTPPFPPIGPEVTGGNIANVGGHAYMIPAQLCFLNVMGGPANGIGSVLAFNASKCYGTTSTSTTAPTPPTGLQVTVQ
jgi:hypothetical protein